jgi:hypothetical protein
VTDHGASIHHNSDHRNCEYKRNKRPLNPFNSLTPC